MGTAVLTLLVAAEDILLMMGFWKEAHQQEISPMKRNSKKIGRMDASSNIDNNLIPVWVGHRSRPY